MTLPNNGAIKPINTGANTLSGPFSLGTISASTTKRTHARVAKRSTPWLVPALLGIAGALVLWPYYPEGEPVAFIGLFSCLFAFAVAVNVNEQYPALPQFGAVLFGVQHVICPMFYHANPGFVEVFEVTPYFMQTFNLSCWASFIFTMTVLGLTLSVPTRRTADMVQQTLTRKTRRALKSWSWYVWIGTTLLSLYMRHLPIPALAYLWTLFLSLQLVSMVSLMLLLPEKKMKRFFVAVVVVHMVMALDSAFFSHFVIGSGIAVILLAHRCRWRWKLVALLVGAVIFASAVQAQKDAYRTEIWNRGGSYSLFDRFGYWEDNLAGHIEESSSSVRYLWPLIERLNQGKIIERVVSVVPEKEEPAWGATIVQAFKLVMPRIMWEDKPIYYSLEMFEKYTQYDLQRGTSMGVGPLGECYLNYTKYALVAFFVYSLSIGVMSHFWVRMGAAFPLWWAWYYYVMSYWIKFESDFAKAINATVKSAFVFAVIVAAFVIWQKALGFRKQRGTVCDIQ